MLEPVWAGGLGFCWGLGPVDLEDETAPLPESVEDQAHKILSNLDSLLTRRALSRADVVAVRINVSQFPRFEKRIQRALAGAFANGDGDGPSVSLIGVTYLPRDALVAMDFVIRAA